MADMTQDEEDAREVRRSETSLTLPELIKRGLEQGLITPLNSYR